MPINLISKIKPKNNGSFPIYEDVDVEGGFQVRATISARNNIPTLNRKEGMLVYVVADGYFYQLGPGLTNSDWAVSSMNNFINGGISYFSNVTALKNFNANNLPDGYLVFVASNLSWYEFVNSAAGYSNDTTNFLIIQPTTGPVNGRWFRTDSDHPIWLSNISNFYINESSGSNENSGVSSSSPLKNWQELYRRIGNNIILNDISINIDGYLSDEIIISPIWTSRNKNINIIGTFSPINVSPIVLSGTTSRNRATNTIFGLDKGTNWSVGYERKIAKYTGISGDGYGLLLEINPLNSLEIWSNDFYVQNSLNPNSFTLQNPTTSSSLYAYNLSDVLVGSIETIGKGVISFINCQIRGDLKINNAKVNFVRCISGNSNYLNIYAHSGAEIYINTCFIDSLYANQGGKVKITNSLIGTDSNNNSIVLNGGVVEHTSSSDGDLVVTQSSNNNIIQNLLSEDGYVCFSMMRFYNLCILKPSTNNIIDFKVPHNSAIMSSGGSIYGSSNAVNTGFIVNISASNCTFMCQDTSPNIYIKKDNSGSSLNDNEFQLFGNTYNFTDDYPVNDLLRMSGLYQY